MRKIFLLYLSLVCNIILPMLPLKILQKRHTSFKKNGKIKQKKFNYNDYNNNQNQNFFSTLSALEISCGILVVLAVVPVKIIQVFDDFVARNDKKNSEQKEKIVKVKNEPEFIKKAERNIPSLLPALFNQLIPMQHYAHVVFGCQKNNFDNEYEKTFCEKFLKIHNNSKELKRCVDKLPEKMKNAAARVVRD